MKLRRFKGMHGASVAALVAGIILPATVHAQDTAPTTESASRQTEGSASKAAPLPQEIVVTGSRLANSGFTAPTPVTVMGQEELKAQAVTNVGDLLNTLPAFRPQSTPATVGIFNANAGANTADLRGLGGNRTLVLVNSRRFVAATTAGGGYVPSGTVDLNLIPTILIQRTEVVTGGASAAYGSDAVAGVVNLILDNNFTGVRGTLQGGISQRDDFKEVFGGIAAGTGFAEGRGHVVAGVEYSKNDGLGDCYTRDWCAVSYNTISNPQSKTNGLPAYLVLPDTIPSTASFNGLISSGSLRGIEFRPDGSYAQHDYGTFYGTPPSYANGGIFQSGGGYDDKNGFYNNFPLVAPVERIVSMGHASFEVSPALELFAEGSYGRVIAHTIGAAPRYTGNIRIQADNAYLPEELRDRLVQNHETGFNFGRIANDFGAPQTTTKRDTWRAVVGAQGDLGGGWQWDAHVQHGETDYNLRTAKSVVTANALRAYDAVDEGQFLTGTPNGNIVCRSTLTSPAAAAGCEPINLFGENRFDPAALNYIFTTVRQDTKIKQTVAAVNLQGDLVSLQGGELTVAIGGEYRVEDAEGTTDPISAQLGVLYGPGSAITGPATKVKEAFAEVGVPLLADLPFARSLSFNGAIRLTDYSTSGSVTSWKLGATWEPTDFMRFRATRSRDIRAPNFFELYAQPISSFQFLTDPKTGGSGLIPVLLTGNANLKPEIADTLTAGVVLTAMSNIQLSVDYYDIKLKGAISNLGGAVILNRCAAGVTSFCDFINRSDSGALESVNNPLLNLDQLLTRGIDMEARVTQDLSADTQLSLRVLGTYLFHLTTTDSSGNSVDRAGQNGGPVSQPSGLPRFQGTADVTLTHDRFRGTLRARYVSSGKYNALFIGPGEDGYSPLLPNSIDDNHVNDYWNFDVNLSYKVIDKEGVTVEIFGVVNNLFDRDPPNKLPSAFGVTNPVLYDIVGRRFKAGVRFSF